MRRCAPGSLPVAETPELPGGGRRDRRFAPGVRCVARGAGFLGPERASAVASNPARRGRGARAAAGGVTASVFGMRPRAHHDRRRFVARLSRNARPPACPLRRTAPGGFELGLVACEDAPKTTTFAPRRGSVGVRPSGDGVGPAADRRSRAALAGVGGDRRGRGAAGGGTGRDLDRDAALHRNSGAPHPATCTWSTFSTADRRPTRAVRTCSAASGSRVGGFPCSPRSATGLPCWSGWMGC